MMKNNRPKPENSQWTDDQWSAITEGGKDLLVAAAAGSGKTAVLVERIIEKIIHPENAIDVDRLLVVTFTKAAALEMKERLQAALEKALKNNPRSNHLRKQLHLINRAQISTLHSFCKKVISSYSYLLEIDPGFRLADEKEVELLLDEVIEQVLEDEYSKGESAVFIKMADQFTSDRSDDALVDIIRKLIKAANAHPFPKKWLADIQEYYGVTVDTLEENIYIKGMEHLIEERITGYIEELTYLKSLTLLPGAPYMYGETIEADLAMLERLREENRISFEMGYNYYRQEMKFVDLKQCRDKTVLGELKKEVQKGRNRVKGNFESFSQNVYKKGKEGIVKDFVHAKEQISELTKTVTKVMDCFSDMKRERSMLDFTDLEHMALQILLDENAKTGEIAPSAVAKSYQDYFEEIYIDEFQDINYVQEAILSLVSKSEGDSQGNRFMVGDVKQSIYRFRLAEPKLFISKYETFAKDESEGLKIDLSQNFRSREEVLDVTNFVFEQIMGKEVGDIDYDDAASLKLGASYYPEASERQAEFILISKEIEEKKEESVSFDAEEDEDESDVEDLSELENAVIESRYIAKEINRLIETGYEVYDKSLKAMRPMKFSDVSILVRSMPWAPQMVEELKSHGIPVYAELNAGYFEAIEIKIIINVLKLIDNPHQDIPLASVLRSPIVGLSENELAEIRSANPKGDFYDGLKSFLDNGEQMQVHLSDAYRKVESFYTLLQEWREKHQSFPLYTLIWSIVHESGYYDFLGAMSGGKQRQANIEVFYERARQFERTAQRGIYRFLRYIDRLIDRGDDFGAAHAVGETEDVVRIMTIHKSKGLEFPIVFAANLGKKFNTNDLKEKVLMHKEFGMAMKYVDLEKRITYQTLPQVVIKETLRQEMFAEEMRVLYVAMTRAKEKLYLVATVNKAETLLKKWKAVRMQSEVLLPSYILRKADGFIDWLGYSFTRHESMNDIFDSAGIEGDKIELETKLPALKIAVIGSKDLQINVQEAEEERIREERLEAIRNNQLLQEFKSTQEFKELLHFDYQNRAATTHEVKQSVTELKRKEQEVSTDTIFNRVNHGKADKLEYRPQFYQEKKMSAAEKGTATHFVMQHVPLDKQYNHDEITNLLLGMVRNELLTEEEYKAIDIDSIVNFYQSFVFELMKESSQVYREMPFTLSVPATSVYNDWKGEEEAVLIQGMIDCLIKYEGRWILVDFKTDTITGKYRKTGQELDNLLREKYMIQMRWYKRALETIIGEEVSDVYLYYFDGNHIVKV